MSETSKTCSQNSQKLYVCWDISVDIKELSVNPVQSSLFYINPNESCRYRLQFEELAEPAQTTWKVSIREHSGNNDRPIDMTVYVLGVHNANTILCKSERTSDKLVVIKMNDRFNPRHYRILCELDVITDSLVSQRPFWIESVTEVQTFPALSQSTLEFNLKPNVTAELRLNDKHVNATFSMNILRDKGDDDIVLQIVLNPNIPHQWSVVFRTKQNMQHSQKDKVFQFDQHSKVMTFQVPKYSSVFVLQAFYKIKNTDFKGMNPNMINQISTKLGLAQSEPTLLSFIKQMFAAKRLCDVTICVENKKIPAHKLALSHRSDKFYEMFVNHETSTHLEITDLDYGTVQALMDYIYEDIISPTAKDWQLLLKAANIYRIHCLKLKCEQLLIGTIDVNTMADLLALAHRYDAILLLAGVNDYMEQNELNFPDMNGCLLSPD